MQPINIRYTNNMLILLGLKYFHNIHMVDLTFPNKYSFSLNIIIIFLFIFFSRTENSW